MTLFPLTILNILAFPKTESKGCDPPSPLHPPPLQQSTKESLQPMLPEELNLIVCEMSDNFKEEVLPWICLLKAKLH